MNKRLLAIIVLVVSLVLSGCGPGKLFGPTLTPTPPPTPTSTPTPTPTSSPTNTPLPTEDPKFLSLNATSGLLKLLNTWNGKYVIFVNKDTGIKTLKDLNGKNIYCDMYTFGIETSVSDMAAFQAATGVQMEIGLGNNIPQFFQQMSEDKNLVAFIPKSYADSNSLQDNPDLKIVVFK